MALGNAQRRTILKGLYDKISQISEVGFVLPSPQRFVDAADFWALNNPKLKQKEIETTPISYLIISRSRFEDEEPIEEGCVDNPLTYYDYNFRLFRQSFPERVDEESAPDDFLKRLNLSYELFCDGIDALKAAFQGIQPIDNLPEGYSVETTSLTQNSFNQDIVPSEEVPKIVGFYADFNCRVEVLIND